jgi:prophage DNA circulation protein
MIISINSPLLLIFPNVAICLNITYFKIKFLFQKTCKITKKIADSKIKSIKKIFFLFFSENHIWNKFFSMAKKFSAVAEMFSAIAEMFSAVAEMFSAVAEMFSAIAEMFSAVAEMFSAVAEMFSAIAEMFSAVAEMFFHLTPCPLSKGNGEAIFHFLYSLTFSQLLKKSRNS